MKRNSNSKIILIVAIILILIACSSKSKNTTEYFKANKVIKNQEPINAKEVDISQTPNERDLELIEIKELSLNGKLSWKTTLKEIRNNFEIDSIIPLPKSMELSNADKLIYIGKSYFEYFEKKDYCELGIIVFDEKINSINLNGQIIETNTTSNILSKRYSNCSQTGEVEIHGDNKKYKMCHIDTKDGQIIDMQLLFFFKQNKLKRIDVWYPS